MSRVLYSIEFRLILGFAFVLALVLGSVSVYARSAAAAEVQRFEDELTSVRDERLGAPHQLQAPPNRGTVLPRLPCDTGIRPQRTKRQEVLA